MKYTPNQKPFFFHQKVYFGDTDAAGVVHHARYIHWMEAARIDYLDNVGYPYEEIQAEKIGFMPVNIQIRYKKSLKFADKFKIKTYLIKIKKASIIFETIFLLNEQIMTESQVTLACIDEETWKPMTIPDKLITKIINFENN